MDEETPNSIEHVQEEDKLELEHATTSAQTKSRPEQPDEAELAKEDESDASDLIEDEEELDNESHDVEEHELEPEASVLETDAETHDMTADEDSLLEPSLLSEQTESHHEDENVDGELRRKASKRTEDLISAAARDIVAHIEQRRNETHDDIQEESIISTQTDESHDQEPIESIEADSHLEELDEEEGEEEVQVEEHKDHDEHDEAEEHEQHEEHEEPLTDEGGEGAESGSQQDDVFSEKSNRSSLGSLDGGSEAAKAIAAIEEHETGTVATYSPRVSNVSSYVEEEEEEEFVPTARGTPRPPFRTPSDVRAIQMSSPTPSVFGGSPRSSKRPLPTVSRLGTPTASAQFSPRNRSTPPRFKIRPDPPLVLLHATLLPLRWTWGDLLNSFEPTEMSDEAKRLRDAWRILQDRMGDTVLERGILIGHPQNDYEVLEERLLDALELPQRRRARILECGHYLGPANEMTLGEDEDSEDDYDVIDPNHKRHWCTTCKSEIRYDSLGPGKVFRVKIYASNGLMKSGAWAACWKEMERVDVELEPILEPGVLEELERLAATQEERDLAQQHEDEMAQQLATRDHSLLRSPDMTHTPAEASFSASELQSPRTRSKEERREEKREERRRREEERLREIYGEPSPEQEPIVEEEASTHPHPDSYIPRPSPPSPSEEAYVRRETRRRAFQSASLPELLLESLRVLMQDRKNVIIVLLGFSVLLFALRTAPQDPRYHSSLDELSKDIPTITTSHVMEDRHETVVEYPAAATSITVTQSIVSQETPVQVENQQPTSSTVTVSESVDTPVASQVQASQSTVTEAQAETTTKTEVKIEVKTEVMTERETVKLVETVTETIKVTSTEVSVEPAKPTMAPEEEKEEEEGVEQRVMEDMKNTSEQLEDVGTARTEL